MKTLYSFELRLNSKDWVFVRLFLTFCFCFHLFLFLLLLFLFLTIDVTLLPKSAIVLHFSGIYLLMFTRRDPKTALSL